MREIAKRCVKTFQGAVYEAIGIRISYGSGWESDGTFFTRSESGGIDGTLLTTRGLLNTKSKTTFEWFLESERNHPKISVQTNSRVSKQIARYRGIAYLSNNPAIISRSSHEFLIREYWTDLEREDCRKAIRVFPAAIATKKFSLYTLTDEKVLTQLGIVSSSPSNSVWFKGNPIGTSHYQIELDNMSWFRSRSRKKLRRSTSLGTTSWRMVAKFVTSEFGSVFDAYTITRD